MQRSTPASLLAAALLLTVLWTALWTTTALAADVKQRTAIVCVFDETRSLTSFEGYTGAEKPTKVRSWFTQWLFSDENSSRSAKIRFLWEPKSPSGPRLRIESKDTHHVLVRLMSQTRDSLVAASSASDMLTAVGWLFSINFKLEQVMATTVKSNAAGMKSQAVRLSCSFDNDTPEADTPAPGNDTG